MITVDLHAALLALARALAAAANATQADFVCTNDLPEAYR